MKNVPDQYVERTRDGLWAGVSIVFAVFLFASYVMFVWRMFVRVWF